MRLPSCVSDTVLCTELHHTGCRACTLASRCQHSLAVLVEAVGVPAAAQVGVYALHDSKRNLQYVGYARNMVLAVRVSLKDLENFEKFVQEGHRALAAGRAAEGAC